jgi:hypothetical protein
MSQPNTCFGLFYLGHLQVGYLSQRKIYNSAIQPLKSGGGRDLVYKNGACARAIGINICIVYISLSIIGRLVGALGGSGFLQLLQL